MRFAGYAAVFDRVDRGGDVVRAGAIRVPAHVPLLWQHRGAPVGRIERVAVDATGLRVIGAVDDPALARLVAAKAVDGLSFGYRVRAARRGRVRELTDLDLVEISLVARPMQPLARVHAVSPSPLVGRVRGTPHSLPLTLPLPDGSSLPLPQGERELGAIRVDRAPSFCPKEKVT